MEYHFEFDSEALNMQEPGNALAVENLRKKIEQIIGKSVTCRMVESRRLKGKVHYFLNCDGDVDVLLKSIDGKIEQLKELGIRVILWGLYGYEGQCNMEWTAEQLKIMGDNNIHFCVSCWEEKEDVKVKDSQMKGEQCFVEGCNNIAEQNYRICAKHLKESRDRGFDDSNK